MGKQSVAKVMAKMLEKMGTEVVFGVNGHGNWALLDAFVHETKINVVAARAEDQAVQMADGYWRMKRGGPLPIVTTSVGPGNTNIVPAIAQAFYESIALVVLAGAGSTHWFDRGGIEEAYRYSPEDWISVLKPITKKSLLITRPDNAIDMLLRAYHTALSGRPGPVVVEIPFDIQNTLIDDDFPDPKPWTYWYPTAPAPAGIAEAASILEKAERPMIVVGSGIHNAQAWDELLAFAEAGSIPVATTSTGKGAFPEVHKLALGAIGRAGTGQANEAARRCDVVVAVGTHFTDIDSGGWTLYGIPDRTKLIHLDIDFTELNRAYPSAVALTCDAKLGLKALTEAIKGKKLAARSGWLGTLTQLTTEWREETEEQRKSALAPLHYARICHDTATVVEKTNKDLPILFDTGHLLSFAPPFMTAWSRKISHCGFFHRMGWSASAIIGASIANGRSSALALIGDGSFLMGGVAVATAFEQDLPIVWVVFDNRSFQIERELMIRLYGREAICDYKNLKTGELWNPDLMMWARSMGAEAVRVDKADDYAPALEKALAAKKPYVIDVAVNLDIKGYRSVWYPYPSDFYQSWKPGNGTK